MIEQILTKIHHINQKQLDYFQKQFDLNKNPTIFKQNTDLLKSKID